MLLIRLGGFEVQRVVHRDGNLRGHTLHEFDFGFAHSFGYIAAKTDRPQAMLGGGERDGSKGVHAFGLEALHEIGVARFFGSVESDERQLILPDPT